MPAQQAEPSASAEPEETTQDIEIDDETSQKSMWIVPFPIIDSVNRGDNYVRTTKYTLLTFLPLNIFYQFRRFYNIYFLVGALTVASGRSSLSPFTQIFPLVVVFFFAAVKEAIEDWSRYTADREANHVNHTAIRNGEKVSIISQNFKPGDIFYIEKGERLPVDAMLISSSYEDGTCFIETANLDGETNLKRRSTLMELNHLNSPEKVLLLKGKIECEYPNENLNVFTGRLVLDKPDQVLEEKHSDKSVLPLTMNNVLLRGCVLRNTDYAYAMTIYTGKNTKIIKNLKEAKQKTSNLERKLNMFTLIAFLYNAFLLISSVLFELQFYNFQTQVQNQDSALIAKKGAQPYWWNLDSSDKTESTHILLTVLSFFALYTYVIPISLFVTMEITRLIQGRFMMWDNEMKVKRQMPDGTEVTVSMTARNTNLNEELGNVDYVFSDKTGTLTQNDMRAARWFVAGKTFDEMNEPGCLLKASKSKDKDQIQLFCLALGLCHSVIPAFDEKTSKLIYESQSPDETALLNAMRINGMELISRNKTAITVKNQLASQSDTTSFQPLAVLEFNSDRKRMSVIVKMPNGEIHLYCKGADNVIIERLASQQSIDMKSVSQALQDYSVIGLRTLCVAYKKVSKQEWTNFKSEMDVAEAALTDRQEKIDAVAEKIEKNMTFVGCTAIEDRLQDQVPETIEYMLQMGIKVWLLTGDKQETAINIGMSTRLIGTEMNLVILEGNGVQDILQNIDSSLARLDRSRQEEKMNALVISGSSLSFALLDEVKKEFLKLCMQCHSVICCRVTPLQKALVVKLVKTELKVVTLAIGDGANDVSMIQAADIGVGIQGREGAQAVRASDYAFGEFRFLKRLLSVHGRYSFHRLCQLIFFSFYKNITLITVQWWFGFVSGWSGQTAYEEIFLTVFNVVFTSLPPFCLALFDKDVNEEEIDKFPQLYKQVKKGLYWNFKIIFGWFLSIYWHSLAIFGSVYFVNSTGVLSMFGYSTGYWIQCYLFGTPLLTIVMFKISMITRNWVWLNAFAVILSLILNVVIMFIVELMGYLEVGTPEMQHVLPSYYLTVLLVLFMALVPDFFVIAWKRCFHPTDADVLLEESKGKHERRVSSSESMSQVNSSSHP